MAQAASWSLKRVSHQQLPAERAAWESWHAAESRWSETERAGAIQALESQDAAEVVAALRQLSEHPLYRHENAAAIVRLLEREEPELVLAACAALSQLDSMLAADELVALLARPEEDVRAAAHAALLAISGRQLPAELRAWQQALGG